MASLSKAALYGKGIFTTLAIIDSSHFLWEKHWHRLSNDALVIGIDLSEYAEDNVRHSLECAIANNKVTNGRARITFFDETESKVWGEGKLKKTTLSIITGDLRPISNNFRLTVSPYRVNSLSPLAGIKSCNYLENLIALDEAKERSFNEAIQINERGEVASATMANVFWLKDDILYTPSLKTGCLPGTTREFILENLDCREIETTIDMLHSADAIFLTSAGLGVAQVAEFESRKIKPTNHPILDLLPKRI